MRQEDSRLSMLETRNVLVDQKRTSIRLEPEFWTYLHQIVERLSLTLPEVCTAIALGHRSSSYTAAVRVFILNYYRARVAGMIPDISGPLIGDAAPRDDERYVSRFETDDKDFDRRTIWVRSLLDLTPETGMFRSYWQWTARQRALGRTPTIQEMMDGPFADEMERGTLNLIDTTPENPEGFLLSHLSVTSQRLQSFAAPKPIGELDFKMHARSLARETHTTKLTAEPHVASISQRRAGVNRAYVRLALPLTDETGRVVKIATIVRGLRTKPSIFHEDMLGLGLPLRAELQAACPAFAA